jgi:hypothetical protein
VCAGVPTSLLVGVFAWPVVLPACAVPAALAAPVFMQRKGALRTPLSTPLLPYCAGEGGPPNGDGPVISPDDQALT